MRVVVCAANRYPDGRIVLGIRHFDAFMHERLRTTTLSYPKGCEEQGFVDQFGIFMNRREALHVAAAANQVNTRRPKTTPMDILFSEDLY
jgi:hypothetical protein